MSESEIRSTSRLLVERRKLGEETPGLLAEELSSAREVTRRLTGGNASFATVGAVVSSILRPGPTLSLGRRLSARAARTDRIAALAMATYWYASCGRGLHVVSADEKSARETLKACSGIWEWLGCDVELLLKSMSSGDRRNAYAAMVTVGSYSEFAADYLRDNLYDSLDDVVQRGSFAALIDDGDRVLLNNGLSLVTVSGPRDAGADTRSGAERISRSFLRDLDYRTDRTHSAVFFTDLGMSRLRSEVGWLHAPGVGAVTLAERVEHALVRREGIVGPSDRQGLADASLQGFLRSYSVFWGLFSKNRLGTSIDIFLSTGADPSSFGDDLAVERVIDQQRSEIYEFRAQARAQLDMEQLMRANASAAVAPWKAGGPDTMRSGLLDVLAGHVDPQYVDARQDDLGGSGASTSGAVELIMDAMTRRREMVGAAEFAALVRETFLTLIDLQWRDHIARVRFMQRQRRTLYPTDGADAATIDLRAIFSKCLQIIRLESIKYVLNVDIPGLTVPERNVGDVLEGRPSSDPHGDDGGPAERDGG